MYCQRCGIANVAHAVCCKACAEPIVAPAVPIASTPAPVVTQAMAATARLPLKSPFTAGALSWLWPGLGCCYVGMIGRGFAQAIFIPMICAAAMYLATIAAALGELGAALVLAIGVFFILWAVACDAADQARKVNAARTNARVTVRAARA